MMDINEFEVQDVFSITGRGTVVTGSLLSGTLSINMKTTVGSKEAIVGGIEAFRQSLETIAATDEAAKAIGVVLTGVEKEDLIQGQRLIFEQN